METKACRACAKGKRRCSKETPVCVRCRERGIDCVYAPNRPSCFVLLKEDGPSLVACTDSHPRASNVDSCAVGPYFSSAACVVPSPQISFQPGAFVNVDTYLSSIWFNLPSTWEIKPWPQRAFDSFQVPKIKRLVSQVQQWFREWVSTGSNPFIHAQLYRHHLPQCVQDAYTSLSTYIHRTPENEQFVFQILEARLTQLVADDGITPRVNQDEAIDEQNCKQTLPFTRLDTLSHLARVQALTTHLLLMLFNGKTRLRKVAEQHIPLLEIWILQMVEDARITSLISAGCQTDKLSSDALWYLWIIAESLRRTFLIGRTVVALYEMLKAGEMAAQACMGGMVVTVRKGAWEAKSAAKWHSMAGKIYMGLMQVEDAWKWVNKGGISKVQMDPFARMFLEATFENDSE